MLRKERQDLFNSVVEKLYNLTGIYISPKARSRSTEIIRLKGALINALWYGARLSKVDIAELLCIHHSTVIHHNEQHLGKMANDPKYSSVYPKIYNFVLDHLGVLPDMDEARTSIVVSMKDAFRVKTA